MTIFEKIISREIPAEIVLEKENLIAFRDVNPQAPVHVLIVQKRALPRLLDAKASDRELLGDCWPAGIAKARTQKRFPGCD